MPSPELEKANRELDFAISLHERLDKINNALLRDKDTMEELVKQMHSINETIVPSCKKMVDNLISIRMTTAREVEYIMQSCRNLKALGAVHTDIKNFIDVVLKLDDVLKKPLIADICKMTTVAILNDEARKQNDKP